MVNMDEVKKMGKKDLISLITVMNQRLIEGDNLFELAISNPGLFSKEDKTSKN